MPLCVTCAVEYDEPLPEVCPICADDRQWVPADGQHWTTLDELTGAGQQAYILELEPGLHGIGAHPAVGIGQQAVLVVTPEGSLLWDPIGYADAAIAEQVLALGPVRAIAASHPHMFGAQTRWSELLGDVPVLVNVHDRDWLGRITGAVEFWDETREVAAGLTLHRTGGHFAGSAVAHWERGAEGRGVLLTGDTVFPNPDRRSLGFLRSYPNKIPLSAAVVERITGRLERLAFDRVYGNFNNRIESGARDALRRSADRHIGWVRGDFDHLT